MAESERCDLRMLSLLYALGDQEALIREAAKLLEHPGMDDITWIKVRNLGRCLAPEHPLFSSGRKLAQIRAMVTPDSGVLCDRGMETEA